jgi:hypothetical protein
MASTRNNRQSGGVTHKHDKNAGSGGFNQGSEQDPDYDKGIDAKEKDLRDGIEKKVKPNAGDTGKPRAGTAKD